MQVAHAVSGHRAAPDRADRPVWDRLSRSGDPAAVITGLRARIADLEVTIDRLTGGDIVDDVHRLFPGITRFKARLLAVLVAQTRVTREQLMTALYGLDPDPPGEKVLDVHICRLRATLPADVRVETWRGRGWQLEANARARILARLEGI